MNRNAPSLGCKTAHRPARGDATRQKLLDTAVEVFGRLGYEGTSTRAVADAAQANLQAIRYYFGGKEGLYLAAAGHVADLIKAHNAEMAARVRAQFMQTKTSGVPLEPTEARSMLSDLLQTLATFYVSHESENWARFVMREQMEPTEAFKRMYEGFMKPGTEVASRLVAVILGEAAESEYVRLRTLSLIGSVLMFRMGHATAMAHLGWKRIGPREIAAIRNLAADLVATLAAPPSGSVGTRSRSCRKESRRA
jgi:AcrR family transcriptional regulator